jgi:hypothetical protein
MVNYGIGYQVFDDTGVVGVIAVLRLFINGNTNVLDLVRSCNELLNAAMSASIAV